MGLRIPIMVFGLVGLLPPVGGRADPDLELRLAGMDLPARVGQLFLVSFPGERLGPDAGRFLARVRPGGVLLYRNNTSSPAGELFNMLQALVRGEIVNA